MKDNLQNKNWVIIINPISGKHFAQKHKEKLMKELNQLRLGFEMDYTTYSKHEIVLVQQAIKNGYRKFISVGGDGTLHHIVNGVLLQNEVPATDIEIGVIPLGTGNDWVKQYKIPNNIKKAVHIINQNKIVKQDIGQIKINNKTIYYMNSAGIGFDGFVVNSLKKYKKFGVAPYFIASLMGFLKYKKSTLKFSFNDKEIISKTLLAAFGICSFCGGGMRFTHQVNTADGLFDITIVKNISMLTLIWHIKKMYNGKLYQHKMVETAKTTKIIIEVVNGEKPFIQADGELIGQGDFSIQLIPKAINFVVL